jgi:hypothetical protein
MDVPEKLTASIFKVEEYAKQAIIKKLSIILTLGSCG